MEKKNLDNELWNRLLAHRGHKLVVAQYGDPDDPANVSLECEDCGEVVLDAELYTICARGDMEQQSLRVETPLGAIIARASDDQEYPGIWVDLRRQDADQDLQLAMVEFCRDEGDRPACEQNIITRVWGDAQQQDYTDRIIHKGYLIADRREHKNAKK